MTTEQPQPINEAACGASAVERVVRPCWLMHKWGKWADRYKVTRESTIHGGVIASGIEQERRCHLCNKIQLRTVWA